METDEYTARSSTPFAAIMRPFPKSILTPAIAVGVFACQGAPVVAEHDGASSAEAVTEPAANSDGADHVRADEQAVPALSESDALILGMAEGACLDGDYRAFIQAFSRSAAVRERYTAAGVTVGQVGDTRRTLRQRYLAMDRYPIAMLDYLIVTAESAKAFETGDGSPDDRRYVQVKISQASNNHIRVDWLPGIFEKDLTPRPPDLEEGLGDLVLETGSGGRLLFTPTDTCWELAEDVANPPLEL